MNRGCVIKTCASVGLFGSSSIPLYGKKGATAVAMSLIILALGMLLTSDSKVGGSLAGNGPQFLLVSAMALTPPVARASDRKTLGLKPRRRHHHHNSRDSPLPEDIVVVGKSKEHQEQHGTAASGTGSEHKEERYQKHQRQDHNGFSLDVDPAANSWEVNKSHESASRVHGHSSSSAFGSYRKDGNKKKDDVGNYDGNWRGRGPNADGDRHRNAEQDKPQEKWSDGSGWSKNSRNPRHVDIQQDVREELMRWFEKFVSNLSVDLNVNVDIRHSCGEDTEVSAHDGLTRDSDKDHDYNETSDEGRVSGREYAAQEKEAANQRRRHGHTFHLSMSKNIAEIQAMYFNGERRSMKRDGGAWEDNGASGLEGHHEKEFLATPKINSAIMDLVETFLASGPRHEDTPNIPSHDMQGTNTKSSQIPAQDENIASGNSHHSSSNRSQSGKGERQELLNESLESQSRGMAAERTIQPTEFVNEVESSYYHEMIRQKQSGPTLAAHRSNRPNNHHAAFNRRLVSDEAVDDDGRKPSRSGARTTRGSSRSSWSSQSMVDGSSRVNKAYSTVRRAAFLGFGGESREREALLEFYWATGGSDIWKNSMGWNNETHNYCSWYGVTCTDDFRHVRELNLRNNSLQTDAFPTSITRLTNLMAVDLSSNAIGGSIPPDVSSLTFLRRLDISRNSIDGELPSTIGSLTLLEKLQLSDNMLKSQIPSEIGLLQLLISLHLNDNSFYGTIPTELGQLRSLRKLRLSNQTSRSGDRTLEGTLPGELANMVHQLRVLDVSHNALTGELPDRLGGLPWLEKLILEDNRFEGRIPSKYLDLPNLKNLTLEGQLVGVGAVGFDGWEYTAARNFTGLETPAPLSLCGHAHVAFDQKYNPTFCPPERNALRSLYLSTRGEDWQENTWWMDEYKTPCDWHGVNCSSLRDLCQTDNATRHCPQGDERRVTELVLRDNGLNGPLPSNIFNLAHLTILELDRNRLTGTMPRGWDKMTNLTVMNLERNQLSGTFPREVVGLAALKSLKLGQNLLTGTIFSNHGAAPTSQNRSLQIFDVAGNRLMDNITKVLHNLASFGALVSINLASNPMVDQFIGENDKTTQPAPPRLCHDSDIVSFDLRDLPAFCPEIEFLRQILGGTKGLQWNMSNIDVCSETSWDGVSCDLETMSITGLRLPSRKLSGTVPDSFSQVPNLRAVNLADNDLSGSLPETLWTLEYLQHVNMSKNSLTGKLPAIQARQLVTVDLSKNAIQGRLPNQLGSLDKISHLDLSSNALTGEIIDELERNPNLEELALKKNSFSGKTPHHLCRHTTINFDLYHQYAWCTANLYKAADILWVSAGVLIALYITVVPRYIILGWKGEGIGFLKWSGIYNTDHEDLSILAALIVCFQQMCSLVGETIRHQTVRRQSLVQTSTYDLEVVPYACQDKSLSTTNRRKITEKNVHIFACFIVVLQVGVAGVAAYASYDLEIIAVTLALSGLLGWHFSLICWASSIPHNSGQWLFLFSTMIVPPTTFLGLLVQHDRSVMIWKYFLMCGILYASWSFPSFVVVHLLQSIWKKTSTKSVFLVQKSMAVIYRLGKALVPVLFFAMRAVGSFRRADDRVEGALWFHERHLAGWVSLFEGLVVTISALSMEVGFVARISFPDMFGLQVTWSELGAGLSLAGLVGFALYLETYVNEFDGKVAKAVVCSFLLGPALQLGCLWSVCREIYHDKHAYRQHRPAFDDAHHATRPTHEQETENLEAVVDGEATPLIEDASDPCSETSKNRPRS